MSAFFAALYAAGIETINSTVQTTNSKAVSAALVATYELSFVPSERSPVDSTYCAAIDATKCAAYF